MPWVVHTSYSIFHNILTLNLDSTFIAGDDQHLLVDDKI